MCLNDSVKNERRKDACMCFRTSAAGNLSQSSSTSTSSWSSTHGVWLRPAAMQRRLREDLGWLYEPHSAYQVFIICLLIICGGELFQSPTTSMSDAATLQILGRDELHKYGAQRAWGPLGWASWYGHCSLYSEPLRATRTPCMRVSPSGSLHSQHLRPRL